MECRCGSKRIATVGAKCSDMCHIELQDEKGFVNESDGYVPKDMGIGGGDYIKFSYCLNCGSMIGDFPLEETDLEVTEDSDED